MKFMTKNLNLSLVSKGLLVLLAAFSLTACAHKGSSSRSTDGMISGVGDNLQFYGSALSPEQEKELLTHRVFYFDYDKYEVRDEDAQAVYAHAKQLILAGRKHVRVEGHTDKRGSGEYNIALGERRARAVAELLMLKGVPQSQISIVSYGKEKPAVAGDDESAFAQNRRVVLVYEME